MPRNRLNYLFRKDRDLSESFNTQMAPGVLSSEPLVIEIEKNGKYGFKSMNLLDIHGMTSQSVCADTT